ncbi:NnrU family protein [Benzoatithermus flavus]|uniref:NnrU family protein n=1 Tax=Benzoatithermus flavus TaxID=3108223 RepID=A0ABU8XNI3_9PROT
MLNLTIAALFLIGTHFGIASTPLRVELIGRVGERGYRTLYSLLALVALAWLIVAWRAAPLVPMWQAGPGLRHLVVALMPLSFLLVVCAVTAPNPTVVGQKPDPDAGDPATGIVRVTRHPFMWGVGLWALLHLLANGDAAAVVFFGTFAVLALGGTVLIDARRTRENAPGWGVFLQATSNLPFAAILQHRQRLVPGEIGLWRVATALALYVLLLWLHPRLFGVSPLG